MVGDVLVLDTRKNNFSDESFGGDVFVKFLFLLVEKTDDFLDEGGIGCSFCSGGPRN